MEVTNFTPEKVTLKKHPSLGHWEEPADLVFFLGSKIATFPSTRWSPTIEKFVELFHPYFRRVKFHTVETHLSSAIYYRGEIQ